MANLPEEAAWVAGIYQLETSDPVLAGPGGIDNRQATELGNRTAYLKQGLEALASALAEQGEDSDPFEQYLLRAAVAADAGPLAWLGTAAGTANALTFNLPADSTVASYKAGQRFQFKVGVANTGAATAKIGDLTMKSILKSGSAGLVELAAGDLKPDVMYDLRFDGTQFQLGGGVGGTGDSVPLFSVQWWPSRAAIPAGYAPADGQALPRATFPDAWEGIQAGNVPTVAEATWQSTPGERGKYTAGDGASTFRLPDYNGKAVGSLGALFLRGDGALSAAVAGAIQLDEFRAHHHSAPADAGTFNRDTYTDIAGTGSISYNWQETQFDSTRGGAETRPLNVTGCWVVKLFGAVTNPGSADAAQLATDYAALAALVGAGPKLTKDYVSPEQTITLAGALNLSHLLGAAPKLVVGEYVCKTAEHGYSVGDVIAMGFYGDSSSTVGVGTSVVKGVADLAIRYGSAAPVIINKTSGASVSMTVANWKMIVRAWA